MQRKHPPPPPHSSSSLMIILFVPLGVFLGEWVEPPLVILLLLTLHLEVTHGGCRGSNPDWQAPSLEYYPSSPSLRIWSESSGTYIHPTEPYPGPHRISHIHSHTKDRSTQIYPFGYKNHSYGQRHTHEQRATGITATKFQSYTIIHIYASVT